MKFSCNRMILLHAKGPNGYRYDFECVLEAINLFLRSCAYKSFEMFSFFLRKSICGHILVSWVLLEVLMNAKKWSIES